MEEEIYHTGHVGFRDGIRPVSPQCVYCPELAGFSLCLGHHPAAYGRRLRQHIRKSQSGLLVGRPASFHEEPNLRAAYGQRLSSKLFVI